MNKHLKNIVKSLFRIESSRYTQLFNFVTAIFLAMIFKIFMILKMEGNTFVSSFEVCVWAFMIVWIVLRIFHSFNMLEGFYALAFVPIVLSMIFPKDTLGLTISIVIFGIGYFIHFYLYYSELFSSQKDTKAKEGDDE